MKTEIYANKVIFSNALQFAFIQRGQRGKTAAARPMVFDVIDDGVVVEPAITIGIDEAQQFIDELWRCGLRPSEGTGSAGSLAATERHLRDMQAITKGLLKKDGIEI
jgi:hypothetical protein